MKALKDAISTALTNFEGKGLTVEQRDGKVYVSMENKLLFQSGSWSVGSEGRKAVRQLIYTTIMMEILKNLMLYTTVVQVRELQQRY